VTALGLATQQRFGDCFNRSRSACIKLRDGAQDLAAMPQQNAEILEIFLCQIADDREVNGVLGELLGVLSHRSMLATQKYLSWFVLSRSPT